MRERAQASVETIALWAAALALAAALLLGVVRLAPPLAAALGQALSGVFTPGEAIAPGLDGLERSLLRAATSSADDGPTLLDLRTHLRLRLARAAADAAFMDIVRPLVAHALEQHDIAVDFAGMAIVERSTEDTWLQDRFHPARLETAAGLVVGMAGGPGTVISLAEALGVGADEPPEGIEPGKAAGDIIVRVAGIREVTLRRRPGSGLVVIADELVRARGEAR